jgi:hypothetical protein
MQFDEFMVPFPIYDGVVACGASAFTLQYDSGGQHWSESCEIVWWRLICGLMELVLSDDLVQAGHGGWIH